MSVESACKVIGLGSEFYAGDIFHADDRAIAIGADHDVPELILGNQTTGGTDSKCHLLTRRDRLGTCLTGGVHRVLLINCVVDVLGRDVEIRELGRI